MFYRKIPAFQFYSVIVFFGNSEFKNVTCNANNTFIIYPRSIRQVVAEILMQPNANYGNKYEIMDVFAKAVQNGNDPMIVSSQINSAVIMVAIRLNLHILYLSTHYSASVGSRTEEDFGSPFIIRVFTSLFRYLVLSQSSNHTYPLPHRPPH